MKSLWSKRTGLAFAALVLPIAASTMALGAEPIVAQKMWLACENGREYPIHPIRRLARVRPGDRLHADDRSWARRAHAAHPDGQRLPLCRSGRLVRRLAWRRGPQLGHAQRSSLPRHARVIRKLATACGGTRPFGRVFRFCGAFCAPPLRCPPLASRLRTAQHRIPSRASGRKLAQHRDFLRNIILSTSQ